MSVPGTGTSTSADVGGVCAIFRRVLDIDGIGAESDFFDLGGDSLLATRVLSAIARAYGVELTFDDFMLAPTPGTLATKITTEKITAERIAAGEITRTRA